MIAAISDFLTSLALIMVAEVEARVVIKKMEVRAEDWKAGRFPRPANSQCFGSFVSLHLADQGWSEENVGFVLTAGGNVVSDGNLITPTVIQCLYAGSAP